MNFRRANIEDIPRLNQISYTSKQHWGYPDEWMERWKADLQISAESIEKQVVIILVIEEQLAGFCVVQEGPERNEVMHLWLLPEYMGQGYGKELLEQALQTCARPDQEAIVTADPNAEGFYAHQGFVTFAKEESYPPGRFLPVMKKAADDLVV